MDGSQPQSPPPDRSPRILILRLSSLGDVVLTLPVLCALRKAFPRAWLAWACEPAPARLLRLHPDLDQLIIVPKRWLLRPFAIAKLCGQLRRVRFQWAIDVQGLTKSALLGRLAGACRQVTFATRDARELSPLLATDLVYPRASHIVERNLQLLQVLGVSEVAPEFRVPAFPQSAERIRAWRGQAGWPERFAIINPGAAWSSKRWPPERFGAVARYLAAKWAVPSLVVWGSPSEHALAEEVVAHSAGAAAVAPPTSLEDLVELARQAALFLSADTGPLHLAAAVGTPCVGLYGPWPAERCGPYGAQHLSVQKMRLDAPSHVRRKASPQFMLAIDVPTVCAACDQILSRKSQSAAA
ncbi:MAG: glycosyltransferase family 9 protein [Thermoguttaceae bacterium]|nr:glycosyltransferase family 9 protein [Thermoguttaceae bacterium]MDW8077803.1 glycosyltransferase family 9 protein [Thermoguttaceae bacterium]